MHLSRIRIINYKSYLDSGNIFFKPGINVVIGPNNSGKTALLEALSLHIANKPHKGEKAPKYPSTGWSPTSKVEFTVSLESEELDDYKFGSLTLPSPANGRIDDVVKVLNTALETGLHIKGSSHHQGVNKDFDYGYPPAPKADTNSCLHTFSLDEEGRYRSSATAGTDLEHSTGWQLVKPFASKIYRFQAERVSLSSSPIQDTTAELQTNASNLPAVLHFLQSTNPTRFKRLMRYVTDVIPSVKWVTAVPVNTVITINIWPIDPETERADLAIDLREAGTGIGQVLAMLYVVFTSAEPRTIIIDEPQSFLHPGAIRKLLEIFHLFSQHQYFISTHSPDILSAANPSSITALEYREGVSSSKSLTMSQTAELRNVLNEIGVRFGDVFFATSILWVEGPTEALAFPLVLKSSDLAITGVTVLPLVNTGDLRSKKHAKKHARLVFEIYNKLSGAHALAPPVVGVVLDREDTREQEMKELKHLSGGLLEFLPRRLYENYLLNPEAITTIANSQENFSDEPITVEQIEEWIQQKRNEGAYLDEKLKAKKDSLTDARWLSNIDGARLLEDLFRHFSGVVSYIKTTHSVELTAWLVNNRPDELKELRNFLEAILKK